MSKQTDQIEKVFAYVVGVFCAFGCYFAISLWWFENSLVFGEEGKGVSHGSGSNIDLLTENASGLFDSLFLISINFLVKW